MFEALIPAFIMLIVESWVKYVITSYEKFMEKEQKQQKDFLSAQSILTEQDAKNIFYERTNLELYKYLMLNAKKDKLIKELNDDQLLAYAIHYLFREHNYERAKEYFRHLIKRNKTNQNISLLYYYNEMQLKQNEKMKKMKELNMLSDQYLTYICRLNTIQYEKGRIDHIFRIFQYPMFYNYYKNFKNLKRIREKYTYQDLIKLNQKLSNEYYNFTNHMTNYLDTQNEEEYDKFEANNVQEEDEKIIDEFDSNRQKLQEDVINLILEGFKNYEESYQISKKAYYQEGKKEFYKKIKDEYDKSFLKA